jgi:hypothetical protein
MLKLYSTVVGGFAQVGANLYGLELPVQRLFGYRAGGKNAGVYGRFMGGSARNRSNSGHVGQQRQYMQIVQISINTGDFASG